MTERLTPQNAQRASRDSVDGLYGVMLENGSMELGNYQPKGIDEQSPHEQDEIYIVQTGTGTLVRGEG
jgi:mannose-6-phosphate isomerase-like protein (cupin superfamily)